MIDGKPMFWISKIKRWVKDKNVPVQGANNATPNAPKQEPSSSSTANMASDQEKANRELAISNMTHQINTAMQSLANAFREY